MTPSALPRRALRAARHAGGFSLIEILVGMVIAMIGVVIMMEVLLTSEQRTRTSNTGNDALSGGAVMLQMMQRDLVQGGYGVNSLRLLGCNLVLPESGGAVVPIAPVVINPPTTLIPAGDANTDRLLVFYGSDANQPEGNPVLATPVGTRYAVQSPASFAVGDRVIGHPGNCTANLTLARVVEPGALGPVEVNTIQAGATALYNLGATPRIVAYRVRNGALQSCDFMAADCRVNNATAWTEVVGNVVSLRAQYGRDTTATGPLDGIVDAWSQTTPTDACGWSGALAVRFALVARSTQYESRIDDTTKQRVCDPVTGTAPTWSGSAGAPINLSGAADWQCYRYRTFENVAPARNVVWMGVQAGC